jgi:hypothetical protein
MRCSPLVLGGPHAPGCECNTCRHDRAAADAWVDDIIKQMRAEEGKRQLGQALSDLLCGET